MLTILQTIKAKLEALESQGIAEVREIIAHAEEAIGLHLAATDEPADGATTVSGSVEPQGDAAAGAAVVDTATYSDGTTATGTAPLPADSPAQQDTAGTGAALAESSAPAADATAAEAGSQATGS